ncbi:MAG: bifunctional phosphoglucose/phosphomannose isomerase [Candidatus Saccharimonadales bacterium]
MLDDANVLKSRDPEDTLQVASSQFQQSSYPMQVIHGENDGRDITRVVVAGMGGSALAALLLKTWLKNELQVPFEIVRTYDLPDYVDYNTLVIASSYSGNTEETLRALNDARGRNAQVAIITSGGKLQELSEEHSIAAVLTPGHLQPRMAVIYGLRALVAVLARFNVVRYDHFGEIADLADWLHDESSQWGSEISTDKNYAKQLALLSVGKTPVFYGGALTAPVAYKWKISWNENAKNLAFWNEYPEFNHNEFIGWTSHPIEKPFVIFDLISHLEDSQILKRFAISDKLLSGLRPKANTVSLKGDTLIAQLLWASILADFVSIYVAILNAVDPAPVVIIEKLKAELA